MADAVQGLQVRKTPSRSGRTGLAAAVLMGDYPDAFITYDDRLAAAARKLKLRVVQPGR